MTYIVYILYSDAFKKHYTGFTSELEQRILSHNFLGKDWTKAYRPWKLLFTQSFNDKLEAMKFEKWLKTGAGRDFINKIQH